MSEHKCSRCGFESKYKHVLVNHLRKKLVCPTTFSNETREVLLESLKRVQKYSGATYDCVYCEKTFNTQANCYRHQIICKNQNTDTRLAILEEKLKVLEQRPIITQNINTTNNNQNIQNIIINVKDFGKENLSYLNYDFLSSCLEDMDLVKLIKNIHCNEDHPENYTVRLKNIKEKLMEKRKNGEWIVEDTEETLSELIKLGYKVLNSHYRENKDAFIDLEEISDWLIKLRYNESSTSRPIKKQLLVLFVNNKALLLSKDT